MKTDTRSAERLTELELRKAVTVCVGLALLAVPLMIVPEAVAAPLRAHHPVPHPIDASTIAISLSLCTFAALAKLLRIGPSVVFVRPIDRAVPLWGLFGAALALAIVATVVGTTDGTLAVDYAGVRQLGYLLLSALALAAWAGVMEEILVRGYLLSVVGHRWNWPLAIGSTSALFAAYHLGAASGPTSRVLYLAMTGAAGVLFALVTYYTGNVWNAVAIHTAWNTVFSSYLLAFREPGEPSGALLTYTSALDASAFGRHVVHPAESPFATLLLAVATGAVFAHYHRRAK